MKIENEIPVFDYNNLQDISYILNIAKSCYEENYPREGSCGDCPLFAVDDCVSKLIVIVFDALEACVEQLNAKQKE